MNVHYSSYFADFDDIDELKNAVNIWIAEDVRRLNKLTEENEKLREALAFTIRSAEYMYKPDEHLPQGLPAIYYHSLSYAGDLELIEKTKEARKLLENK